MASWSHQEHVCATRASKRSLGVRGSTSMVDDGSGYSRGSAYGMKMTTWLRGKGPGAHGEADDRLSWLGDDRKATNPSMESGGRAGGRRLVAAM